MLDIEITTAFIEQVKCNFILTARNFYSIEVYNVRIDVTENLNSKWHVGIFCFRKGKDYTYHYSQKKIVDLIDPMYMKKIVEKMFPDYDTVNTGLDGHCRLCFSKISTT